MTDEKKEKLLQIRDKMVSVLDDLQYEEFVNILYEYGFFNNMSDNDIFWHTDDANGKNQYIFETLSHNGVSIGIDVGDGQVRFGLDPSTCFNKTSDCSVIVYFPMSKREYRYFLKVFGKLIDRKSAYYKAWAQEAPQSWCGNYATFGSTFGR